ncbi:MAG: hypothetical protein HY072_05905 [Deltaproteobacteria bacterium]|nr:hypothetical protein [Deltaproteobacteria bacterium]
MKTYFIFLLLLSVSAYAAGTKLEISVEGYYFDDNKEFVVDIQKLNIELNHKGLDGLPETAVVGENPKAYWNVLTKRVEAANKALNCEMHFNIYDDGYGEGEIYKLTMCYRGAMSGVTKLIKTMYGNFLNPNQSVLAIACGNKKSISDKAFKSREGLKKRFGVNYKANLTNINKWLKYNKNDNTVLIMSDYGSDGDGSELEATYIPPCEL